MSYLHALPDHILRIIEAAWITDFVSISAKGLPINTPAFCFPADDLSSIDIATGMPNPAKAERVRRNPNVGLMIEGEAEEPIIVVRGHGAVRDRDLQANALRYVAETGYKALRKDAGWAEARLNIQYWTRIILPSAPERIYWWDNREALAGPPHVWNAEPGAALLQSDPAPTGTMKPSAWKPRDWRLVAADGLAGGQPPHLAVIDADGFPLPMRALSIALVDDGFELTMPAGAPWAFTGPASLTFAGFHTFVGTAEAAGTNVLLRVERALPQLPTTVDPDLVFRPTPELQEKRRERLEFELAGRDAILPVMPLEAPQPTRCARLRNAPLEDRSLITGVTRH